MHHFLDIYNKQKSWKKTFNEIEQIAEEKGILLDGCGTDVRYYTFGVFVDLCDLDYKEPEIPDDMFTN